MTQPQLEFSSDAVGRRPSGEPMPSSAPFRPIQYLGNKLRVLDQIAQATTSLVDGEGRIADLFTGTTVVAQSLARCGYKVTAVDTQKYAIVFANALLGVGRTPGEACDFDSIAKGELDRSIKKAFAAWRPFVNREDEALRRKDHQALRVLYSEVPLIWRDRLHPRYSEVSEDSERLGYDDLPLLTSIYAGQYFGIRQALELDRLCQFINAQNRSGLMTQWQFNVALSAIMSAASSAAYSAGKHFAQPLNAGSSNNHEFLNKRLLDDRSVCIKTKFKAASYEICLNAVRHDVGHSACVGPAERFIYSNAEHFDMYYVDPPYTAQQYSRFYHLLETIVTYKYPRLFNKDKITTGLYPLDRYKSAFSSKRNATSAFRAIIRQAKKQNAALLISYSGSATNSNGNARMISLEDLLKECRDEYGSRSVDWSQMNHRYRQFNSAGNSNGLRNDPEILIRCKIC